MLPPGRSVLLVAALFLSVLPHTATRASSERCRGSWSPLSQRCPLAEDPAEAVSFAMEKHIAGQPLAARAIHKALARNAKRFAQNVGTLSGLVVNLASVGEVFGVQAKGGPATAPRPLFMHFSGPTGVGKSLTADIIAAAVLTGEESEESERCGKLLLQMRAYASTSLEDIEANSQAIRALVAEQLFLCPRSVLIFDEIQTVPEQLLDFVIGMLDPREGILHHNPAGGTLSYLSSYISSMSPVSTSPVAVNTSNCIVIAISDIGSTKLTADMDREAATAIVQEAADRRFVRSSKRELLQNVMTEVVPFLPLSPEELASVAAMQLRAFGMTLGIEYRGVWMGKLTWGKEVPTWLAEECMSDETCIADGGRGVRTKIELEVQELASDVLMPELVKADLSYNNLHIRVSDAGEALTAAIDTVFDDETEFQEL